MTFTYRPASRSQFPLLLGFAGGTGSGKTYSGMRVAKGLAGVEPFHLIDTENGRALIYADEFDFLHGELKAPFRPSSYADAIEAADKAGAKVIVVDSMSHEWAGDGGMLDWHEQLEGGDAKKKMTAWIEPKKAHRQFVTRLLQVKAHVILCFRAEPKVDIVMQNGQMKIVPKATLTGLDGWIPISDKNLPFELTASFLLMADQPGVPRPIKLPEKLRSFVPLDAPITEATGQRLGEWARGTESGAESRAQASSSAETDGARQAAGAETAAPSAPAQSGAPALPPSEPAPGPDAEAAPQSSPDEPKKITPGQAKQLDVLVGSLRDRANAITTEQLYAALAKERNVDVEVMIALREGARDEEGKLHWGPLRESLNRVEASDLISRLKEKEAAVGAMA